VLNKKVHLAYALDYLELVLGQDWLEKNLKVMKDSHCGKGGFGMNIDFAALGIAYVAKIWYKAREETIDREIVGGGLPGPYSLTAAAIAIDLEVLKDCAGLQTKIDELKDVKLSLKTAHVLRIASGYAQNGYCVDFTYPKASDWPSLHVCAASQCMAGAFMIRGRGNRTIIICAEVEMLEGLGNNLPEAKYHRSALDVQFDQGVVKNSLDETTYQSILYLYVGDTLAETETPLHEWLDHPKITRLVQDYDTPVLLYTTGIKSINNQLAYVRRGRLVKNNQASFAHDLYIPDEIISPLP